ncbi:MAG TPA: hypothetical protein VGS98_08195 [Thermoanaerobaculia bacterium]|nr:hypothetical protein [Thermoanaerobaculia bacterium]
MSDRERPTLRAVDPGDPPPPARRRGPGVAVIAVLGYGLLFLFSLFYFSRQSKVQGPKSRVPKPAVSRASLIEGIGLSPAAREKYLLRLGAERCDCGCDMTLAACLARDLTCVRSPVLAGAHMQASLAASHP